MNKAELRNVTVCYGEKTVIEDFSLEIKSGQILGIVGPSGCGKTTIVRALCGFINPKSGSVLIDDKTVYSKADHVNIPPEHRKIGVVFQDYAVWPHLSVYDNIAYPLKKKHEKKEEIAKTVTEALRQVNMVGYEKYMPAQLSGGQQQRVAIARALTTSSDFLIMDEPITNLDAKLREQMLVEIRMLQQECGATIIYITHDQEAAMQLCDDIVIMKPDGKIAQIGTDEQIIKHPVNQFVFKFIGVSNFLPVVIQDRKCWFDFDPKVEFKNSRPENYPSDTSEALLGIRPMDIVFDNSSPLKAKVTQAIFLGNLYNYFLDFYGWELRVQQMASNEPDFVTYEEDQIVGIRFEQEFFFERGNEE